MEKQVLTSDAVRKTASKLCVSRTVVYDKYIGGCSYTGPKGGYLATYELKQTPANEKLSEQLGTDRTVYEILTLAVRDMLELSTVAVCGDLTAGELAGTVNKTLSVVMWCDSEDYEPIAEVEVIAGNYQCRFQVGQVAKMLAEFEVLARVPKKERFIWHGEGKLEKADVKIEQKPLCVNSDVMGTKRNYAASTNRELAKKTAVIGSMAQSLSSEGMRKAMAVLEAVGHFRNCSYSVSQMARQVMLRKLWRDYGKDKYSQPIDYEEADFRNGPDVWKQVDEAYAKELVAYFKDMLAAAPAPTWIKRGDYVQVKDKENVIEKLRGKLYVVGVHARLNSDCMKITWYAEVVPSKGSSWDLEPDKLEPWVEKPKTKKAAAPKATSKKPAKPAHQTAAADPMDRLRSALRAAMVRQGIAVAA